MGCVLMMIYSKTTAFGDKRRREMLDLQSLFPKIDGGLQTILYKQGNWKKQISFLIWLPKIGDLEFSFFT